MKKNKNIVFVLGSLNIGGAEKVLINYVNGFKKNFDHLYNVEVFLIAKDGELFQYLDKNIKVKYLYLGNKFLPKNIFIRYIYKIYRKIISISFKKIPILYNIFISSYSKFEYGFILVQDLYYFSNCNFGINKYLWIQNNLSNVVNSNIYNNINIYKKYEGVIANSMGIYNDLIQRVGVSEDKVFLCYNPIDIFKIKELAIKTTPEIDFYINKYKPYMVTLGRAVHQKGFDILIDAFEIIASTNSKINLIVIGGGILEKKLKEVVDTKNLTERIHFIGSLSNPYPIVDNADFYVCSSRHEGLPTSMIEAMSLGKPVVSTPCDFGPKEILDNGLYGCLSNDISAKSLAISFLKFLDIDEISKNSIVQKTIERSKYFSTESSITNLIKILSKL